MVQQIIPLRDMEKYADQLFTGEREAKKAAPILKGSSMPILPGFQGLHSI
jgi:hypothetical protein